MDAKSTIQAGKAILGIEFGSTRIKAVLIDEENNPIAQGSHTWENQLVDGLWTYSIGAIWFGLQDCYANLRKNVLEKYDINVNLYGGGYTGQSQALRLAIARALVKINAEDKKALRAEGFMTRDSREVERKKPGRPKARRRFQFSKR